MSILLKSKQVVTFLLLLLVANIALAQTTKTWTGTTSTDWNTASNWSPSGVPSSSDYIVLNNGSLTNMPKLDASRSITNITVSAGNMDLSGYTLTVTGTTSLTGGAINNGTITFNNSTTTIAGTTFNAKVNITASSVTSSASIFNAKVVVTKTGTSSNTWTGGNTFNDTLDIRLQSTGTITMYGTNNDIYNGHILVSNTSTGTINFGGSGSGTLANGKKITIGSAGFSGGSLGFTKFTQNGSTPQSLTLSGTSILYLNSQTTWNGKVTISSPDFRFNGSTFNKKVKATLTSTNAVTHTGGSTFNDTLDMYMTGGVNYLCTYSTDNYNGPIFLSSTGTSYGYAFAVGSTGAGILASGKKINVGTGGFSVGSIDFNRFTQNGSTAQSLTLTGSANIYFENSSVFNSPWTISSPNVYFHGVTFNSDLTCTKTGTSSNTCTGGNTFNGTTSITVSSTGYLTMANTNADTYNGAVSFIQSSTGLIYPANNGTNIFAGNISVNTTGAAITFANGSGIVKLSGTATQTISRTAGSNAVNIKRIETNKSSNGVTLNCPISVANSLTFTSGNIITTSTNIINLADNATVSGASNSSYVEGPISKTGNDAFTFPVGKGGSYRSIAIAAPTSTASVFTAEYFSSSQTLGSSADTSLKNLSSCEYWTLTRSGSSDNVNVTPSWNANSCNGAKPANMRVAAWSGSTWSNKGNGSSTGNNSAGTVTTGTTPTTFTAFALANKTCSYTATITPSGSTTACSGTLTLSANNSKYYKWGSGELTQVITPLSTSTYSVDVRDTSGCKGSASIGVTIRPLPTVKGGIFKSIVPNDTTSIGDSITVTGGSTPYTYSWNPSTRMSNSSIKNPNVWPLINTNYLLTVTDRNGCQATTITYIQIVQQSSSIFDCTNYLEANSSLVGGFETFDCSSIPTFNASDFSTYQTPALSQTGWGSINTADFYTTNTITGCTNPPPQILTSSALPRTGNCHVGFGGIFPSNAEFVARATQELKASQCYKVSLWVRSPFTHDNAMGIILKPNGTTPPDGGSAFNAVWSGSSIDGTYKLKTYTFTPSTTGVFILFIGAQTLTGGSGMYFVDDVSVRPFFNLNTPPTICPGQNTTLTASCFSSGTTFSWSPSTGLSSTTGSSVTASPSTTTTYTVTATFPDGCTDTEQVTVNVNSTMIQPIINPTNPIMCTGGSVVLNVSNPVIGYSYNWYNSSGTLLLANSISYTATSIGSYYVIATYQGCTSTSASVTVTISTPSVSLSISPSTFCINQSYNPLSGIFLSGGSPSGGVFSGNGIINGYGFAPDQAGVGTHSITYTYTDPSTGCSGTASNNVTVTAVPSPPVIISSTSLCDSPTGFTANNIQANTTYTWSGPSGTSFTSSPNVIGSTPPGTITTTVTGITDGIYYLTASNAGGCSAVTTFAVNPNCTNANSIATFCNTSASVVLSNSSYISAGYVTNGQTAFTTGYQNGNNTAVVIINGTFTIDVPLFRFLNANVILGQNAKIIVDPSSTYNELRIEKSYLHACSSKLWDGIYVTLDKDYVDIEASTIEDARNALVSLHGGKFLTNASVFNKNYKSIIVQDWTTALHQGKVQTTDFTCSSNILVGVPPVETTSYSPYKTRTGIEVKNVSYWTVTPPTLGSYNNFDGINQGITCDASRIKIYYCNFKNLITVTPTGSNTAQGGTGIYGKGSWVNNGWSMITAGDNGSNYNTFLNIPNKGILVTGATRLSASFNKFTNVKGWAISANNSIALLDINQNTITTTSTNTGQGSGIEIVNPGNICFVNITNNTIDFNPGSSDIQSGTNGLGIKIATTNNSAPWNPSSNWGYFYLNNNNIYRARTGIWAQNIFGKPGNHSLKIEGSQISLRVQPGQTTNLINGIKLDNADYAYINSNHIYNAGVTAYLKMEGIRSTLSDNSVFLCNTIENIGKCFFFQGNNGQSKLKANAMLNSTDGIYIYGPSNNPGIIGTQGAPNQPWDNTWTGWTGTTGTYQTVTDGPTTTALSSKLYVRTGGTYSPIYNFGYAGATDYNATGALINANGQSITCPAPEGAGFLLRQSQIAQDSIVYGATWKTQGKYLDQSSLYQTVVNDTTGDFSSSIFSNFKNRIDSSFIGFDVAARNKAYQLAVQPDTAVLNKYLSGAVDTSGKNTEKLFTFNHTTVTQAQNIYNSLRPANALDSTAKGVHSIIVNSLARYNNSLGTGYLSFTSSEITSLTSIAQKCALTYGPDVYIARSLLMGVNDSLNDAYTLYTDACESTGSQARLAPPEQNDEQPPILADIKAILYPNPAQNSIYLAFNAPLTSLTTLQVFDATGKFITMHKLVDTITQVDIANYSNGLYIYHILQNGSAIQHGKFIVNN